MRISSAYIERLTVGTLNVRVTEIDHGGLVGLADDDHSIYLTTARADTWFTGKDLADLSAKSHISLTDIGTDSHATIDSHIDDGTLHFIEGSIDHGSISGLSDDDHSIYTLRTEWNKSGFENQTDSVFTWSDSTPDRTLSIQPTGISFNYWVAGIRYISTGDIIQISPVEGIHVIYYDTDGITSVASPTRSQLETIWLMKAPVSIVYWDTSGTTAIYVGEERHGIGISPDTHNYLHWTAGLQYEFGIGFNTTSADGAGATDDAQFGVDAGEVADEDLHVAIDAVICTVGDPK